MITHKAVVLEMFGMPGAFYFPGDGLELIDSSEYPGYYWIVKDGKQTRDLIGNGSKQLFKIVEKIKKAS